MTVQMQSADRTPKFVDGRIFLGILTVVLAISLFLPVGATIASIFEIVMDEFHYTNYNPIVLTILFAIILSMSIGFYLGKFIQRIFANPKLISDNVRIDFGGAIGRAKFAKVQILGWGIIFATFLLVVFTQWPALAIMAPIINIVVVIKYLIAPTAQRTRSLGLNPWLALILLVPFVNIPFYVFLLVGPEGAARSLRSEV